MCDIPVVSEAGSLSSVVSVAGSCVCASCSR